MKLQLLASVLITSIVSNPIGTVSKLDSVVQKPSYSNNGINKPVYTKYNSPSYVSKQLGQKQHLPSQNKYKYRGSTNAAPTSNQRLQKVNKSPELANLFQQIEELNNIVETEGDNLDAWKTVKTTAKGVFDGAKKFYNSPAGQKTRDVVRVLLENKQNSLTNDQDSLSNYNTVQLPSSNSLDSNLSGRSQVDQSDNFEAQKQEALQDLFLQIDDLNKTLEKEDGEGDNFGVLWGLKKAKQVYDVAMNVKDMIFPKE